MTLIKEHDEEQAKITAETGEEITNETRAIYGDNAAEAEISDRAGVLNRGRDSLIEALNNGRPMTFCVGVYQHLVSEWQKEHGIMFAEVVDGSDRQAMIDHLKQMN